MLILLGAILLGESEQSMNARPNRRAFCLECR